MKQPLRGDRRRRVRPLLLALLWVWAACVFLVVDLFLNVEQFDQVRPRAPLYLGMRKAAHDMVGESLVHSADRSSIRAGSVQCRSRRRSPRDAAEPALPVHVVQIAPWKLGLDADQERAVRLLEAVGSRVWPFEGAAGERQETLPADRDLFVPRWTLFRSGPLEARKLTFKEGGLLSVYGSIEESATVTFRERGAVTVSRDFDGHVTFESESTVYVRGDLGGDLVLEGRCSVLIDGNVTGRIDIGADAVVYVQGRIDGSIKVESGRTVRFYIASPGAPEAFEGYLSRCTLHLPPESQGNTRPDERWKATKFGGDEWRVIR